MFPAAPVPLEELKMEALSVRSRLPAVTLMSPPRLPNVPVEVESPVKSKVDAKGFAESRNPVMDKLSALTDRLPALPDPNSTLVKMVDPLEISTLRAATATLPASPVLKPAAETEAWFASFIRSDTTWIEPPRPEPPVLAKMPVKTLGLLEPVMEISFTLTATVPPAPGPKVVFCSPVLLPMSSVFALTWTAPPGPRANVAPKTPVTRFGLLDPASEMLSALPTTLALLPVPAAPPNWPPKRPVSNEAFAPDM